MWCCQINSHTDNPAIRWGEKSGIDQRYVDRKQINTYVVKKTNKHMGKIPSLQTLTLKIIAQRRQTSHLNNQKVLAKSTEKKIHWASTGQKLKRKLNLSNNTSSPFLIDELCNATNLFSKITCIEFSGSCLDALFQTHDLLFIYV